MSNPENDDFEKDPTMNRNPQGDSDFAGDPNSDPEDDFFAKRDDDDFFAKKEEDDDPFAEKGGSGEDPFASLLNADASEEEAESTMARLSHLEEGVDRAGKSGDAEDTEAKLSHLLDEGGTPTESIDETTEQRLSHLLADVDFSDDRPKEETAARLGELEQEMDEADNSDDADDSEWDAQDGTEDDGEAASDEKDFSGKKTETVSDGQTDETSLPDGLPDFGDDLTEDLSGDLTEDLSGGGFPEFPDDGFHDNLVSGEGETGAADSPELDRKKTKKGKKASKTPKISKTKKKKKVRTTRRREKLPRTGADHLLLLSWVFFILIIILGNLIGVMTKGVNLPFFLILFNALGLVLLMIPSLLKAKKKREKSINFYDALMALALTFLILGCMTLVLVQSKYGTDVKVTSQTSRLVTENAGLTRL